MQQTLEELDFERGIWWAAANGDIAKVKALGELSSIYGLDVDRK